MRTVTVTNPDPDRPPANRLEATAALAVMRERDPAGRYELRFTPGGWNVVRVDDE